MNPAVIMIAYMALTISIGLYLTKTNKGVQEFFVAKRGLGVILAIPLLFAEMIAGAGTIGNAADAFKFGFSSVWMNWGMAIGCVLFVLLATTFYRVAGLKMGAISVPEAYRVLFDAKTRTAMLFIVLIVYAILFAMQMPAASAILAPMFGVSKTIAGWAVAAIFIVMTMTGGLRGLAWMNIVHSFVMYLGMGITAWIAVGYVGGFAQMKATLPATFFSFAQPSFGTVLAWILGTAIGFFCSASVVGVTFGGKSLKVCQKATVLAGILVLPFALAPAIIGMAAKTQLPTIAANTALFSMANHISPLIGGIAAMAIIAAIFSTAPGLLLIAVSTLTRDFYKVYLKPDASDGQQLVFSRIMIVVVGVVATYLGMQAQSILAQCLGAFQIRSVAGLVLVMALLWPRVNSNAAFWSILGGGLLAAGWHFAGSPFGVAPLWPSAVLGVGLLVILTLLSKEPVSEGYKRYQAALEEAKADGTL